MADLEATLSTGVKFYSSLNRNQAKGILPIGTNSKGEDIYVEPGAICFVSDSSGNSIFLNNLIFGDGASSGGITEVTLNDLVVTTKDGVTLKTLDDYFNSDGDIITNQLLITNSDGDTVLTLNENGIKFGDSYYATQNYVQNTISNNVGTLYESLNTKIEDSYANSKLYADSLVTSVYRVKGSVSSKTELNKITNPKIGDVYNVGTTLDSINYVYTDTGWDALGGSTVDLSGYALIADVNNALATNLSSANSYTDSKITEVTESINRVSNSVVTLSSEVTDNTTNIKTNSANIITNTTNINNIATQLTWQ